MPPDSPAALTQHLTSRLAVYAVCHRPAARVSLGGSISLYHRGAKITLTVRCRGI